MTLYTSEFPLHKALEDSQVTPTKISEVIKMYPESVLTQNNDLNLPIHTAVLNGLSLDIIKLLVDKYAEGLLVPGNFGSSIPLHIAIDSEDMNADIILYLATRCPASLGVKDKFGYLPIQRAQVKSKYSDIIPALIDLYSKFQAKSKPHIEEFPIHDALRENDITVDKLQELIRKYPSQISTKDMQGSLPIHIAVLNGRSIEILRLIVDKYPDGLSVLGTSDGMSTPLHLAIEGEDIDDETIVFLASRCPESLKIKDKYGYQPIHRAHVKMKCSNIIPILVDLYSEGLMVSQYFDMLPHDCRLV